jgi:hypothetical protein
VAYSKAKVTRNFGYKYSRIYLWQECIGDKIIKGQHGHTNGPMMGNTYREQGGLISLPTKAGGEEGGGGPYKMHTQPGDKINPPTPPPPTGRHARTSTSSLLWNQHSPKCCFIVIKIEFCCQNYRMDGPEVPSLMNKNIKGQKTLFIEYPL